MSYIQSIAGDNGYPNSIANRNKDVIGDPDYFPQYYSYLANDTLRAVTAVNAEFDGDQVSISSQTRFAVNDKNERYRISYILVENNVYEPGNDNYHQHNSYWDGASGEMGGFENQPEWIYDWHFDDVARGVVGDCKGIEKSLPASIFSGTTYEHSITATLPPAILHTGNVEVVALVLDTKTKQIVAAAKTGKTAHILQGDVNGDGMVNVSDVTALINTILGSDNYSAAVCDINGDGDTNVSDVTTLINLILGDPNSVLLSQSPHCRNKALKHLFN